MGKKIATNDGVRTRGGKIESTQIEDPTVISLGQDFKCLQVTKLGSQEDIAEHSDRLMTNNTDSI